MVGDDVLVRGDDGLAGRQGGRDQRPGRLIATHELDHDVRLRRRDEVRGCVGEQCLGETGSHRPPDVADRHAHQLE